MGTSNDTTNETTEIVDINILPEVDTVPDGKKMMFIDSEDNSGGTIPFEKMRKQIADNATDPVARAQIANLAKLPAGSTTGDAELADIRVGANGKVYGTAGEAVRGQLQENKEQTDEAVASLKGDLGNICYKKTGINILNPNKFTSGILNSQGTISENNEYIVSDFVQVENGESYSFAAYGYQYLTVLTTRHLYLFYNSDKMPITGTFTNKDDTAGLTFSVDNVSVKYVRVSAHISLELKMLMMVKGSTIPKKFEEYNCTIENLMDIPRLDSVEKNVKMLNENIVPQTTIGRNLINPDDIENGYIFNGDKVEGPSYAIVEMIEIKENTTYCFGDSSVDYWAASKCRYVVFFNEDKKEISNTMLTNVALFTTPNGAKYITITIPANKKEVMLLEGNYDFTKQNAIYIPYKEKGMTASEKFVIGEDNVKSVSVEKITGLIVCGKNLFDKSKAKLNTLLITTPREEPNTMYFVSDYIPVHVGKTYFIKSARKYVLYDANKQRIDYSDDGGSNLVITPVVDGFLRVTESMTLINTYQIEEGDKETSFEEYKKVFSDIALLNPKQIEQIAKMFNPSIGNVLYGKKWYAVGDSFTDYTNDSYDPAEYPQMKEDASEKDKTYPFWIGTRNNMEVHNIAISGQTLATPPDGTFTNAFSCESLTTNYKYIPDDADYITIQLGINDSNHIKGSGTTPDGEDATGKIEIGTINDTTIGTFYGAWNVILPYLIEHHPFAHIGIIVSIGSGEPYVKATIECAKKWGIAYLNMDGDYQVPLMHRTYTRFDTCEEAKNMRLNAFSINKDGGDTHPNVDAHKYQSIFIENWMRSI